MAAFKCYRHLFKIFISTNVTVRAMPVNWLATKNLFLYINAMVKSICWVSLLYVPKKSVLFTGKSKVLKMKGTLAFCSSGMSWYLPIINTFQAFLLTTKEFIVCCWAVTVFAGINRIAFFGAQYEQVFATGPIRAIIVMHIESDQSYRILYLKEKVYYVRKYFIKQIHIDQEY